MKKYLRLVLILVALLATSLQTGCAQYPDWEWEAGNWVYTGIVLPPPPPPPAPSLPRVR